MTSVVWAVIASLVSAFTAGFAVAVGRTDIALWCTLAAMLMMAYVFWPDPNDNLKPRG